MFRLIDTDPDSGIEVFQLTDEATPADPIYGEQPYSSADGRRLVVRHQHEKGSRLSVIDLADASVTTVFRDLDRSVHPAFHAWGRAFFFWNWKADRSELLRVDFASLETTVVCELGGPERRISYGTVSQDERWYAAVERDPGSDACSRVWLWDLASGRERVLLETEGYFAKHEQFSLDGRNRLLLQCNFSGKKDVKLAVVDVGEGVRGTVRWLAASGGHTLPPSGHQAWVPSADRIVFSTRMDEARNGNLWEVGVEDSEPRRVVNNHSYTGHVAVSHCARYWIGDGYHEPATPVYMGRLDTPKYRRVVDTKTGYRGRQIDHTHLYLTSDSRWIIFGSSRSGCPQIYGARLTEPFLNSLEAGGSPRERPQPTVSCPSGGKRAGPLI